MDFNSFKKTELIDMLNKIYKDAKYMEECANKSLKEYELNRDTHDYARAHTFDSCASWIHQDLGIKYQKIE